MNNSVKPKDKTTAKRTAALKDRLLKEGGKRTSINVSGARVRQVEKLIKRGFGRNFNDVVGRLIDES